MASIDDFYRQHPDPNVRAWYARTRGGSTAPGSAEPRGRFAHLAAAAPSVPVPPPKGSIDQRVIAAAEKRGRFAHLAAAAPDLPQDATARLIVLAGRRRRELAGEKV